MDDVRALPPVLKNRIFVIYWVLVILFFVFVRRIFITWLLNPLPSVSSRERHCAPNKVTEWKSQSHDVFGSWRPRVCSKFIVFCIVFPVHLFQCSMKADRISHLQILLREIGICSFSIGWEQSKGTQQEATASHRGKILWDSTFLLSSHPDGAASQKQDAAELIADVLPFKKHKFFICACKHSGKSSSSLEP